MRDERGAALVEFTIVATALMTLLFGSLEIGLAWSDSQVVTQAARSGARSSSQLGIDPQADSFAVQSIEAALGDLAADLSRIVIYDASAADGAMDPACESAGPPGIVGQCSVYDQSAFGTYATWTDGAWPPSARNNALGTAHWVGIRVEVERPSVTGFIRIGTFSLGDTTVMRIEPEAGS